MSKEKVLTEEMKSERKSKIIFGVILVASFVIGLVWGLLSPSLGDAVSFNNFAESVTNIINSQAYYAGTAVMVIVGIVTFVLIRQSRKAYELWDEEDDYAIDKIEEKLSWASIIVNGSVIFTYIFSVIGVAQIPNYLAEGKSGILKSVILILGIFLAVIILMIANAKIVNFEKELNPEKKGSVYDTNFHKKWMDSSDEAEKLVIYKCGFAAYKSVNTACLVLFFVCMFGMEVWNWDNIPVLMVGVIWLVSYFNYSAEALKLSKHATRIQE